MYLTMKALCFIERALKYIIIHISISISTCKVGTWVKLFKYILNTQMNNLNTFEKNTQTTYLYFFLTVSLFKNECVKFEFSILLF